MELTAIGFVLLPLSLICMLRPGSLLRLALVASAFGAAVPLIIQIGGEPFGLPASFLPALLFLVVAAPGYLAGKRQAAEGEALRLVMPLLLFAAVAVAGAVILPRLFAGEIMVWPQREVGFSAAVPLEPGGGNLTQSLYLAVNAAAVGIVALYVTRPGVSPAGFVRAYLLSGYVVVALSLWQFANKHTGLYFPESFIYSNPRWAILTEQATKPGS